MGAAADSIWGDDADQQTLGRPSGSSARIITLFATLGIVLLLVVLVKFATPPERDPTKEPAVGERFAKLQLAPLEEDGEPLTIDRLQGQVVLINFWGPWCPPCLLEFPELMELREGLAKREDFRFVSVACMQSGDEEDLVKMTKTYLLTKKYDLPIHRDSQLVTRGELSALNHSNNFAFPTTVLLDRTGTIRAVWTGYRTGIGEQMREHIERLLKEPAAGH
jgi:thiol-disulfide isomerase/thioredoxin